MKRKLKIQSSKLNNKFIYRFVFFVCAGTILIIGIRSFSESLFFIKKDRVNVVFYGKETTYYSLGKQDGVNYVMPFYPDIKVNVPEGYGNYRVGGLGKLMYLEKKGDILRKTFSVMTASSVDRYFYEVSDTIFYGKEEDNSFKLPGLKNIFYSASNSNLFDRLFVWLQFVGKRKQQFEEINFKSQLGADEEFFLDRDFAKKYQGFLYNRLYRDEQKTVQIQYKDSYKTAYVLSRIIEGDGIRVTDLMQQDSLMQDTSCEVVENTKIFSQSARDVAIFFSCQLKEGTTESSDIIIKLNSAEKDWFIL